MLKLVLACVQILIGFYWAGDMARQNPKINDFVAHLEDGYGSFNDRLKDVKVIEGLIALRKLYGYIAIVSFVLFFFLPKLAGTSRSLGAFLSTVGMASVFGWFSIKWCVDHKKAVAEIGSQVGLLIFGPVMLGAFDLLMGTRFMAIIWDGLYKIPAPASFHIPHLVNPIAIGGSLSLLFAVFLVLYYLIAWLLTVPAAFFSAALVLLPVAVARLVHTVAPRKAVNGCEKPTLDGGIDQRYRMVQVC
ncbi:hypothetical protein HDG34_005003 [Paraburkholderia sp. HC6.4b]|uniref:hypothetical protein n=1 Tax=unclassified Paraburkholderia TaxID=2615204 RepID=UPI00161E64D7|nr:MULTISPECIES: hypothetical protein [unclassified Paraburkholderia]MBB5411046.1 hypothetical protein [Paraburkholderia sp. HC6.4b]MBB5455162.1 hypothetical protein [Paraburkholderia sp. Kb1A]